MRDPDLPLIRFEFDDFTEPWNATPAPVVILHPGLGGNSELYRMWVPVLADRYRVLRVTARGQGGTPRPDDYERSLANFSRDVIDVLDHLDIESAHWTGASGGGIIGQYAAIHYPDRIRSLGLIATTAQFHGPKGDYDEWLAPLDDDNQREFLLRDTERRFGTEHPARTEWIIDQLCRTGGHESAAMHRWVKGVNLIEDLPKIQCPTLIVTAAKDELTSVEDAKIMLEGIPNAREEILPGLPHNIAYTHPHEVATLVREFLDEIDPSA